MSASPLSNAACDASPLEAGGSTLSRTRRGTATAALGRPPLSRNTNIPPTIKSTSTNAARIATLARRGMPAGLGATIALSFDGVSASSAAPTSPALW